MKTVQGDYSRIRRRNQENTRGHLKGREDDKIGKSEQYPNFNNHKRGYARFDISNIIKPEKFRHFEKAVQIVFNIINSAAGYSVCDSSVIVSCGVVDIQGLHTDTDPTKRVEGDTGKAVMNFSFIFATHPETFIVVYDKVVHKTGEVSHKARKLEIKQGSVCFFRGDCWHSGPWFLPSQGVGIHFRLHGHIDSKSYKHTEDVALADYDENDEFDFDIVPEECLPWNIVRALLKRKGSAFLEFL